jgi:hypothetical protein
LELEAGGHGGQRAEVGKREMEWGGGGSGFVCHAKVKREGGGS